MYMSAETSECLLGAEVSEPKTPRLSRVERREQILAAATKAFAASGFTSTSLDEVAAATGVTRVILYRHFDSKADLYQAVLDRMCARLEAHVDEPVGGFTDDSIDGLLAAATESPSGFRLLFQHALREADFKEPIEKFRADIAEAAHLQIRQVVPDHTMARWAAQLAPAVAIEATIAWLDAGQPDPEHAAARIRRVVMGVVEAAVATDPTASLPATREGQGNEWNGCQGV
jgi:AcrR family transcriptional regulator